MATKSNTADHHILVVDDKLEIRKSLLYVFSPTYRVTAVPSANDAAELLARQWVDLILLDVIMPDKDGLVFLQELKANYPDIPVIMLSAVSATHRVVEAIKLGAYDYITKPYDIDEIRHLVERALVSSSMARRIEILQSEISREFPVEGIVGESPDFKRCLDITDKTAKSDSTCLITGESGTGKELIARLLHSLSNRRNEPIVAVHCASLTESLMESELFGYEKGAFTNADKRKIGHFEMAGAGTLFLDEVSEISASTQVKLLRVLQEREFRRVGGTQLIHCHARIVAATGQDLKKLTETGKFRDDLYYRLSVVPIALPPLRERIDDIPLLAYYFLNYFRKRMAIECRDFDPKAIAMMKAYHWPGNIRELRNVVERMLVLYGSSSVIRKEFLPPEFQNVAAEQDVGNVGWMPLDDVVQRHERAVIERALRETDGNQSQAAKLLGTTRRKLRYRMDKFNIGREP